MAIIKQVVGTSGSDTLDGGIGVNEFRELFGGAGDDVYLIDMGTAGATTADKVLELPGGGTDTVMLVSNINGAGIWSNNAASKYVMPEQVENLAVFGPVILDSALVQIDTAFPALTVIGNSLNNHLTTGSGNDTLNGGLGSDIMAGGGGADTYFVDSAGDVVVEGTDPYFLPGGPGAGVDTVNSFVSFTLGSGVENLVFDRRAGNVNGTGNVLGNSLTGSDGNNVLDGGAGDDLLFGLYGNDILKGGDGNDQLFGIDQTGTLFTEFDNLAVSAPPVPIAIGADLLDGGNGDDILWGYDLDTLLGGAGNDMLNGDVLDTPNEKILMDGGLGDDLFQNFGVSDTIKGGTGIDTVQIDFGAVATIYTLPADVERGILANGSSTTDTLIGNTLNNYLQGNAGNDMLFGLAGEDVLDGGTGADRMIGGDGNDSYMVDNLGDTVVETGTPVGTKVKAVAAGGIDTVFSYIAHYTLGANVENLVLEEGTYAGGTGGAATNGKGNALDNVIVGNSRNNLLEGGAGNDTLDGGTGADTLIGGAGNDTYAVDRTSDIVQELADYTGYVGGIDTVNLVDDLTINPLPAFRGVRYTLPDNVENLNASAITHAYDSAAVLLTADITLEGNSQNNTIVGSMLNDTLIGGAGNDSMSGGAGGDTYYVQNAGDVVIENLVGAVGGTDTVMFSASLGTAAYILPNNVENLYILGGSASKFSGNASNNLIVGNGADNVIDGGAGNDLLQGGGGNDTLTDSVGNNIFDGGAGYDTMKGGKGDDIYYVDTGDGAGAIGASIEDVIVDAGGKADTVRSLVYSYTLGAGLENLELLGNAVIGIGSIDNNLIRGNANNNRLDGQAGNDILDGGLGADRMIGGTGNDTFYVDDSGDVVQEENLATGGIDTVVSAIDYSLQDTDGNGSLGGGVENLTLAMGAADAIRATGNGLINILTGNEFDNVLDGATLEGAVGSPDTLIGGDGNDTYLIDSIGDRITEQDSKLFPGAGTADVIYATLADGSTYVMDKFVEQLHLLSWVNTNNGNVNITGNDADNVIWGNFGVNIIIGGLGNDTLVGGDGNDRLDGGAGDDILNGDGAYQTGMAGVWVNSTPGADTLIGGAGNDIYYVNVGDGALSIPPVGPEDVVIEAPNGGIDTVRLVGTTITNYKLDAEVENLDLSGLTGGLTVSAVGNTKDNVITGQKAPGNNVLQGGDGNDTFLLTLVGNASDVVRGGSDAGLPGGSVGGDTGLADILRAKVDTTAGTVNAGTDIKQLEAIALDVSNMTSANGLNWSLANFGDPGNFTGNPANGGLAPTFTISGGPTGGQASAPDTSSTTVGGNITLTNLTTAPTYQLVNYNQAADLSATTTLTLASSGGSNDVLTVLLDNHSSGGLASAGVETLKVISTGDVLDNTPDANVLNVSAVTATSGTTLIDATGNSSQQILGLSPATAAGTQQTVFLHDFDAANFTMKMSGTGGTNFLALRLDNVETSLTTDAGNLENFAIDVTGSSHGNVLHAGNLVIADQTYLGGDANSSLTLDQWRGNISTAALTGFNNGFNGKLNIIGANAITLTADGGDVSFHSLRNSTLQDPNTADTFVFDLKGSVSSLDNLDDIDGGGGNDTLTATVDGLEAASTGQLFITNVEDLTFNLSAGRNASIDASHITVAGSITIGGSATTGNTLSIYNSTAAILDATGFNGNLIATLMESPNNYSVTGGTGNDNLSFVADPADSSAASVNNFDLTAGGNDTVLGSSGADIFNFGNKLTGADSVDGGGGDIGSGIIDTLNFTDNGSGTDDLDKVRNIDDINLGDSSTAISTVDALVAAGALLTVDGSAVTTGMLWDGSLETDGRFDIIGGNGADSIMGGAGDDFLRGGNGADVVQGKGGDDRIVMVISAGNIDTLDGGLGNDTLILTGTPAGAVVIDLASTSDQITTINAIAEALIQIGFENVDASGMTGTSSVTVTAAAAGSTIIGGGGADTLTGGNGDDILDGRGGVDTVTGGLGNDLILWDKAGGDALDGGTGGSDTLMLVTTATGAVTVDLSLTGDQVTTGAGIQTGFENFDGSVLTSGALTATASASGSTISGGNAADTLTGGAGTDVLNGNGGADTLSGGGGSDVLTGGSGADHFVFNSTLDGSTYDVISDFLSGTDIIDLSHLAFPAITTAGSGGGTAISPAEFAWGDQTSSTEPGVFLVYNSILGNLYYDADGDGAQVGQLIVHLDNAPAITAVDIHITA